MPAHHATLFGRWCAAQNLTPPDDISDCIRFHANLRNGDSRAPGLIFLLRDLHTDEAVAIQRLFLDEAGNVIARRTLGRTYNTAIKLDADDQVATGLHVASNIEDGLKAMVEGYRPLWIVSALADLPVLNGVDTLTIIGGNDANAAAQTVATRWQQRRPRSHHRIK